jgi:CheY-like chemotaxis protein
MTKVLVVDDEPFIRMALVKKLTKDGFEVLEAENGVKAVETALANHPDIITCDLVMPEKDGSEVVASLREDSWGKSVPILLLSNSQGDERLTKVEQDPNCKVRIKSSLSLDKMVGLIKETLNL